jgi:hypothetical protein
MRDIRWHAGYVCRQGAVLCIGAKFKPNIEHCCSKVDVDMVRPQISIVQGNGMDATKKAQLTRLLPLSDLVRANRRFLHLHAIWCLTFPVINLL